jgi:transcriptional regulator with XRE-family HTH domain
MPPTTQPQTEIAEHLRETRLRLGLTQRQLGELLGVDMNTVSRWERRHLQVLHPAILRMALDTIAEQRATTDELPVADDVLAPA